MLLPQVAGEFCSSKGMCRDGPYMVRRNASLHESFRVSHPKKLLFDGRFCLQQMTAWTLSNTAVVLTGLVFALVAERTIVVILRGVVRCKNSYSFWGHEPVDQNGRSRGIAVAGPRQHNHRRDRPVS